MFDYHNHSNFSDDANTPIEDMVQAAYKSGLKEIAITDHYDPDYPDSRYPFTLDFKNYHSELERVKKLYEGKIKVIKGIEIGIQQGKTLAACKSAALAYNYDFIIGSFHCVEGIALFGDELFAERSVEESYKVFYEYMYYSLKLFKEYDVIGHFNIIDRYAPSIPKQNVYMDIVEEILKLIISDGKGLEINTSSFRYGLGERTTPAKEILNLYKDLGGEIITIGSDAHSIEHVNYRLDKAIQMIKDAELKYVTTFDQRRLEFHKL